MRQINRRIAIVLGLLLVALALPALASAADPTIIDTSPDDGTEITTRSQTFDATVNDSDFSSGDSVEVRFIIDGTVENTQTITSESTVSYTHDFTYGGDIDWYVEAEDSDGNVTRSPTKNIFVPADLRIENESDPGTLITNETEVSFYGNGQIYTKTTTDGTLNLTGLPPRDYVLDSVVVDGSYIERSNYILDPYRNKTLYHLRNNLTTIESRFNIRDQTGIFSSASVIELQRGINESGLIEYETVAADRFGSEGFTATLEADQRYRVRIISENMENIQVIGPYRSDVNETVTIQPGNPVVNVGDFEQGWNASIEAGPTNSFTAQYNITYIDPKVKTEKVTIWLTSEGFDGSTSKTSNVTFYDVGTVYTELFLFAESQDDIVVANFVVERNGERYKFTRTLYRQDYRGVPVDLDNGVIQIMGGLMMLLTAGLFSQRNHETGAVVVVAIAGVLWYVSLDGGLASQVALLSAGLIALLFKLAKR